MDRFDRQVRIFGDEGQCRLKGHCLAIVGAGGLGSIVVQEAAYLGVGRLIIIDDDCADETSLNRTVGVFHSDIYDANGNPVHSPAKASLAARMVHAVAPECAVRAIPENLGHMEACGALVEADSIIGCVDNDATRLVLTEVARALERPYLDMATDIDTEDGIRPGGRIFFTGPGKGCLTCSGEIDVDEASVGTLDPSVARDQADIYGVGQEHLGQSGPSIVTLNGVVASLGMTEWLWWLIGLREPRRKLVYRADMGRIWSSDQSPSENYCHLCDGLRGRPQDSYYLKDVLERA